MAHASTVADECLPPSLPRMRCVLSRVFSFVRQLSSFWPSSQVETDEHLCSKSGLRSLPSKLNLAAVIVMFALTTIYVIVDSLQLWAIYDVVGGSIHSFESPILSNSVGSAILQAVYGINVRTTCSQPNFI